MSGPAGRPRELAADALVGLALFIVALWLLRRVVGMFLWAASLISLVVVVIVLLGLARAVRGRR
jgi:hypothetical protein